MTIDTKIQFEKQYHTALQHHLRRQRTRRRLPARSAGVLGRAAVSLGLDTLDLARMHDRAVAGLALPHSSPDGRKQTKPLAQAGAFFFLEVLTPVEQTHPAAQAAALHAQQIDARLRERTAALADFAIESAPGKGATVRAEIPFLVKQGGPGS
ncbi:hypothetical protein OpiT1DRAFT_05357 [Opitutaceae bacterium TAV1]|nr:hypothetical protein OpiT1DRAFT_05357 [Opitutaceae bacterium TAV1]